MMESTILINWVAVKELSLRYYTGIQGQGFRAATIRKPYIV